MLQKIAITDSTGTLEKALERNLLKVKHDRPMVPPAAGLDLTLGEVLGHPSHSNPAPGGTFQGVGSVSGGSAQCNDEENIPYRYHTFTFFSMVGTPCITPQSPARSQALRKSIQATYRVHPISPSPHFPISLSPYLPISPQSPITLSPYLSTLMLQKNRHNRLYGNTGESLGTEPHSW